MKQALEGKLYIGKKIKKIVYFREGSIGPVRKDKKIGVVTGLYPFMFTVDFGKYTESFGYGQFFEKGSEVVRV
nr:MAG TPA: biofilm formation stimulator [Caudoviricetes sp.]